MSTFNSSNLKRLITADGLLLPDHVVEQVVAAIDSGKHIILTGPPGTGKTTLAYMTAELARRAMLGTGYLPTTATSEWTTFDTIGGMLSTPDGMVFRPGLFIEAIEQGRWLVIDEMNRSNFDRAFGQLFTVLSGSSVVVPFSRNGQIRRISIVPYGVEAPANTDPIRLPATWRIIATMNAFDKHLLFDMSYALMRRFAFIEVSSPPEEVFIELVAGPGSLVEMLLPLRSLVDLGPAIFLDAAKYSARRLADNVTRSRVLYEAFYAYFLPQFDGLSDEAASAMARMVCELLDPREQRLVLRQVDAMFGLEMATH